ncbi:hypothetical protein GY45DRAFT_1262007 [Cubamyces sp. BRFM 1775]|nr:hypothetical protein GY45DRAFT_1262007 [Cubamyces sp. BRFM 1775]
MAWAVLTCDNISFSMTQNSDSLVAASAPWESAKVSMIAMSDNDRWLMIITESNPSPAVWRAIKDSWVVASDEPSMTMFLQYTEGEEGSKTTLRLRFNTRREFWTFAAQATLARVSMLPDIWNSTDYSTREHGSVSTSSALVAPGM